MCRRIVNRRRGNANGIGGGSNSSSIAVNSRINGSPGFSGSVPGAVAAGIAVVQSTDSQSGRRTVPVGDRHETQLVCRIGLQHQGLGRRIVRHSTNVVPV